MRIPVYSILFLIITLGFMGCKQDAPVKGALQDYIPESSDMVLMISNLETFNSDLKNNGLVSSHDDSDLLKVISGESNLLSEFKSSETSLLTIQQGKDSTTSFTWIARYNPNEISLDSIFIRASDSILHNKQTIAQLPVSDTSNYVTMLDSVLILSSTLNTIKDVVDGEIWQDSKMQKLFQIKNENELGMLLNLQEQKSNLGSHLALDLSLLPDRLSGSGVMLTRDSVPQLLNVFQGLIPQQNDLANIIPSSAKGATVFTYNDAELLAEQLREFRMDSIQANVPEILESINEIGLINLDSDAVIICKSIDTELSLSSLSTVITEIETFREVQIYSISEKTLFENILSPLAQLEEVNFVFSIDEFFVFAPTETAAKSVISAYKSNAVLSKMNYFANAALELSNASSLLFYDLQGLSSTNWKHMLPFYSQNGLQEKSIGKYPFAAAQFSYDRNFAHLNIIATEANKQASSSAGVVELFSTQLDEAILGRPQFFTNHRSLGQDVVVQDVGNQLYLIANSGKILWKKRLEGPILGDIREVDILRNGKKQLAFATEKTFYILDRNGNEVSPFPLEFKDKITQPLSVFDYDNNRKYRFVITQGEEVFMYDSKAKLVSGFTFKKAASNIVLPPQHVRTNNKDYILIAEESGKLNILSRVGKNRIKVSQEFQFSNIPIAKEKSNFVIISKDLKKYSIAQSGKVTQLNLEVSNDYSFTTRGSTKVTLDDNLLRVNGRLIELPFGIYSSPEIHRVNRKTYISVTEIQEKKVYLYDLSGRLSNGFPVYGTGKADVRDSNRDKKPDLVVKGSDKEIILYILQ